MAMKKKAAAKKGDEPVRMGRAKAQPRTGFLSDPYGYTSNKNPYKNTRDKSTQEQVKKYLAEGKKKYGTKFFVTVNDDSGVDIVAGATKKGIKAQSARMTKQSNRITSLPKKKK